MAKYTTLRLGLVCLSMLVGAYLLSACNSNQPAPTPTLPANITFYDWENDMPQSALDAFQKEYGIAVTYETYASQDEAQQNLRAGKIYDVVVMESRYIPLLGEEGLLSELDHSNLPNFRNISPNFRNLNYDPTNKYCMPYSWGTTGLLVRSDLIETPVTRWADLWDERYQGKVALWKGEPQEVIAIALKSLGYSANSADPNELMAARERLLQLAPHVIFVEDYDIETAAGALADGGAWIAMGYAYDYAVSHETIPAVEYVMPEEGALLWGDTFVIPANSPNKQTAELFINFMMRPEINALVVAYNNYATANAAALNFVDDTISGDPVIFPPEKHLLGADIILPLSAEVQKLHSQIWADFIAATGQ